MPSTYSRLTEPEKQRRRMRQRERYAANKTRVRLQQRQYYTANRDRLKEKAKRDYRINSAKIKLSTKRWAKANPGKVREYKKKWRERDENREKQRACQLAHHLRTTYGLTVEQRDGMFEAQKGACAICGDIARAIDHCHKTGRIRGILCNRCNQGLGHFRDDTGLLLAAVEYLIETDDVREVSA